MGVRAARGFIGQPRYGGAKEISERHRHRYEFNASTRRCSPAQACAFRLHARQTYVEIVEIPGHPYFSAASSSEFNPSRWSRPAVHAFIEASYKNRVKRVGPATQETATLPTHCHLSDLGERTTKRRSSQLSSGAKGRVR